MIEELSDQDISDAIRSAQTVGDDRIQQRTSGRVNPDAWTHWIGSTARDGISSRHEERHDQVI
ncbi:MAG: neutral zinc metallopeptidase [Marmoricola sp.]